jgi:PP-loop superfamily ATP-utilizing enzyme
LHAGEPLKDMVLQYAKVNGDAATATTAAIGAAAENVVKAVGNILKEIEMNKRRCTSESGSHSFTKVSDNPACFLCTFCGFRA